MTEVLGMENQILPVLFNFMCQPGWAKGCQTAGETLFLGMCERMSLVDRVKSVGGHYLIHRGFE